MIRNVNIIIIYLLYKFIYFKYFKIGKLMFRGGNFFFFNFYVLFLYEIKL